MKSSLHSLIPFFAISSQSPESTLSKTLTNSRQLCQTTFFVLYNTSARTTQKTQLLYCWERLFTDPLPNNGMAFIAPIQSSWLVSVLAWWASIRRWEYLEEPQPSGYWLLFQPWIAPVLSRMAFISCQQAFQYGSVSIAWRYNYLLRSPIQQFDQFIPLLTPVITWECDYRRVFDWWPELLEFFIQRVTKFYSSLIYTHTHTHTSVHSHVFTAVA
jgi:hypothetical protein